MAATTFVVVALAELGDLTQVLIANLSARYRDPLSVFVGSAAALVAVSALGVAAGRTVVRVVPLSLVRRLSGLVLLGFGVASAVAAAGG
ncbi:MAG: TMEM165/GDT1 family protein [Actinomycetota bacterium]|nr:TMEM165/GDT1 family protein [Actinomycetota bacterium]